MGSRLRIDLVAAALLAATLSASAQDTDACGSFKWSVAREQQALAAAGLPALATGGTLPGIGTAAAVTLSPEPEVPYSIKPARPPKSSPAYGAELTLPARTGGGTIQVTLSTEGWIDVIQGGKVVRSSAFSGKMGCPGIRKSVRFAVEPGQLAIAISDAPEPTLNLAVMPAEQAE